jgi:hypothetical protein
MVPRLWSMLSARSTMLVRNVLVRVPGVESHSSHEGESTMKFALSLLFVFVMAVGFVGADDKSTGKEVTLTGKITCGKCDLNKESKCTTVIVVKESGKDVVYYFDAKGHKDNHNKICNEGKEGKVTGTVSEKDGKKVITVKKVEYT